MQKQAGQLPTTAGSWNSLQRAKVGVFSLVLALVFFAASSLTAQQADNAVQGVRTNNGAADQAEAEAADGVSNAPTTTATNQSPGTIRHRRSRSQNALVVIGKDVELKEGESADAVIVIFGNAKIRGTVRDAVVVIGGDVSVEGGEVGDAVVAVLGSIKAGQGTTIHGDAVAVGGTLEITEGAKVEGEKVAVPALAGLRAEWLRKWFEHCVLKFRPLAPQVGWVWVLAGGFFLLYLLIAAVFPVPVNACVNELTRRPATTFLMGLMTKLLLPFAFLILAVTVIGLVVVPFVIAALVLGFIVGKVAILEWLGLSIGRQFGAEALQKPLAGLLLGAIIITLLYLVPVLGLVTFGIISVWGLGGAVMAAFAGFRKEQPQKSPPPPPSGIPAPTAAAASEMPAAEASEGAATAPATTSTLASVPQATVPELLAYPKASFWERIGAAFLDVVLVSILGGLVGGPPWGFLVALAYFAGMWTWRSTTIGGIVLGLKVVRLDEQPVTFPVALVRALAAAFSVIVLFLGFLWIIWDADKQGWHDKIAGTVVLRLPRGTPLVCI